VSALGSHLDTAFTGATGFVGLFSGIRKGGRLADPKETYYAYPHAAAAATGWLAQESQSGREVYVCAHLLTDRKRIKGHAAPVHALWADGDTAPIPTGALAPTAIIESSPGRWQGFWRLTESIAPERAELLNQRLAAHIGADLSGWDLGQLLRVPGYPNRKYLNNPIVRPIALEPERVFDADELEQLLPALPEAKKRIERAAADPREANDEEPPVMLSGWDLETYQGKHPKQRADSPGQIDRSSTLLKIGRVLFEAGMTRRGVVDALVERDRALGYDKFTDRPDATEQYHRIFDQLERKGRQKPQLTVGGAVHLETPADASCNIQLASAFHELAAARAENATLRAENETFQVELQNLRAENTMVINTTINPHLKAEAATLVRTVIRAVDAKTRGEADERGFVLLSGRAIGDDFEEDDPRHVETPIRSRATVKRHLERLADLKLIEREVRPGITKMPIRKDGKIVIDPKTGKARMMDAQTPQTWIKITGDSVADALKPFAFFRPPDEDGEAVEPKKTHGGDRRSSTFNANRTPCPECGSSERKTYCGSCGCDITEHAEADEAAFQDEIKRIRTQLADTFQDGAQETVVSVRGRTAAFQDETGFEPPLHPTVTDWDRVRTFVSPRAAPPPSGEPGFDRWTQR
jgi:hypothetical protein